MQGWAMQGWSQGYDVSTGYSYGSYREMAPDWLDLAARLAGYLAPRRASPARYLELGTGQGVGLCLLAAANPAMQFVGIDFQPEHVAHAQGLAAAAGLANVRFHEADFVDLAARWPDDLGRFDYVALHGVYSWVSPDIRKALVTCLDHATGPGSLVDASYNSQPGWLSAMPFQHLARLLRDTGAKPAAAVFDDTIATFERLREGGANLFQVLPTLAARIGETKARDAGYLAHEYLHHGWSPLWHSSVAADLEQAKLRFVGTATIAETMAIDLLPPPLRAVVAEQNDERVRQDLLDIVLNQSFRRDIFCRGARRVWTGGDKVPGCLRLHLLRDLKPGESVTAETSFGEVLVQAPAFAEFAAALADDARSIDELAALPGAARLPRDHTLHILLLLIHAGVLAIEATHERDVSAARRLNAVIAGEVARGAPYRHLAAAALGSAIAVDETELGLLDAWLRTGGTADAAALAGADRDLAAARSFVDRTLPRWRRLGVVA